MIMATKRQLAEAERDRRIAHFEETRRRAHDEWTPEAREAVVVEGAELSAWIMANCPPKQTGGFASRASQRQAAERRAYDAYRGRGR